MAALIAEIDNGVSTVIKNECPETIEGGGLGPFRDDPFRFARKTVHFHRVDIGVVFAFPVQRLQVRPCVVR